MPTLTLTRPPLLASSGSRLNARFLAAIVLTGCVSGVHAQTAERAKIESEKYTGRVLSAGDGVDQFSRGLHPLKMTWNDNGKNRATKSFAGCYQSLPPLGPADATVFELAVERNATPPDVECDPTAAASIAAASITDPDVSFVAGIRVGRGLGYARGWRPIIRTIRTTTIADGSTIAVDVRADEGVKTKAECIALLQVDKPCHRARVYLVDNSDVPPSENPPKCPGHDPDTCVEISVRQMVKVIPVDGTDKWDFQRYPEGHPQAGKPEIFEIDKDIEDWAAYHGAYRIHSFEDEVSERP